MKENDKKIKRMRENKRERDIYIERRREVENEEEKKLATSYNRQCF